MPMVSYRCPDCGADDEHFYHSAASAPASIECRGFKEVETAADGRRFEEVRRETIGPDGAVTVEIERVEVAPETESPLQPCCGTAVQRVSLPGEQWHRPARGFEALVIYERVGYDQLPDDAKRSLNRFYVPGRNTEPTEPGMRRIEITNMAEYNREMRRINEYETGKMADHRAMHREYWAARRGAMRADVNDNLGRKYGQTRPRLVSDLLRLARANADRKSARRYGKALNANFHAQLIEFDQGKIQDWCAEDTGWKSKRAR